MGALLFFLLGVSVAASPLTASRAEQGFGPTDIALAVASVLALVYSVLARSDPVEMSGVGAQRRSLVRQFWLIGFPLLTLSSLLAVALGHTSLTIMLGLFAPYVIIAIFALALGACRRNPSRLAWLYAGYLVTSFAISSVYMWAILFSQSDFYFYYRFEGLSVNPNQTAVQAVSAAVICILFLAQYPRIHLLVKCSVWLTAIMSMIYGLATGSDAAKLAILVFVALLAARLLYLSVKVDKNLTMTTIFILPIVVLCVAVFLIENRVDAISIFLQQLRHGTDLGADRVNLWNNGIQAGVRSPIWGNGAGAWSGQHGPFEGWESHDLWIDWFTMTGILGFIPMGILIRSVVGRASRFSWANWVGVLTLLPFAAFHSPLRHVEFWLALDLATVGLAFGLTPRRTLETSTRATSVPTEAVYNRPLV